MKKSLQLLSTLFILHSATAQTSVQVINESLSQCGPIPSVCAPTSINVGSLGIGITYFTLNQINNTSINNWGGGYQDFTCSDSTFLSQGDSYTIEIITGQTYAEVIRVWIDFNNDGGFDSTELIFADAPILYSHDGIVVIPVTGQTGIPLRLRVGSEVDQFPPPDGCNDVNYGQYEDYTVYLNGPTQIIESKNRNAISISSNPFHSTTTISFNGQFVTHYSQLKIYNMMGVQVREEEIPNITSYTLHRGSLNNGLYFYELRTNNSEPIGRGKFIIE